MKRSLLLLPFFLLYLGLAAFAGPDLGGEISYQRLGASSYQVKYTHYRDCQGAAAPATFRLNVQAPGCNKGRFVTLNQQSKKTGKPYGAASPATCSTTLPLFEIVTYTGTVNFSALESFCQTWVLSVNTTDRTEAENLIVHPDNANYYTEARLRLIPGLANSSPVFDTVSSPIMYVNYRTDYKLSLAAKDPDGDSLAYSLVAPLVAANTPVSYNVFPGMASGFILNPNPKPPYNNPFYPQYAQIQVTPNLTFSPTFPILSIKIDWNGPPTVQIPEPASPNGFRLIWAANPYFELNRATGVLQFAPSSYSPNPQNLPGKNKFLVSILVEEFRKINGVTTKIGTVRRETLIQVFDNNPNLDPNAPVSGSHPLPLRAGNATGANPTLSTAEFRAFPNPFSEELNFSLDLNTSAERIVIYNLLGQQVDEISLKTLGSGKQKLQWQNAAKHAAGTYIAKLVLQNKTVQTLKFMKIK